MEAGPVGRGAVRGFFSKGYRKGIQNAVDGAVNDAMRNQTRGLGPDERLGRSTWERARRPWGGLCATTAAQ